MDPRLEKLLEAVRGAGEPVWNLGRRIAMVCHPTGTGAQVQSRDHVEMLYMARGASCHLLGNSRVELMEGELLLLGQNTPQQLLPLSADAIAVSFFLKSEFFGDILSYFGTEDTPLRSFVLRCLGQETPYGYLHFHVADVKPVQNLMENLLIHMLEHPDSRRPIPLYTVGLLFVQLVEESDRLTIGVREQQSVLGVLRYLESNYASSSLTEAAKQLHCDVAWLSREVKRRTGRTYTELLQEKRLQQAAWLLKNTGQKVADIAVAVGYENVSYFHRIFQKRFDLSPKKYRDSQ